MARPKQPVRRPGLIKRTPQAQNASSSATPTKKQKVSQPPPSGRPAQLLSDTPWSKATMQRLRQKPFGAHLYLDWEMLADYGKKEEIKEMLSLGPWAQLFAIRTPAHKDITLEVLGTLRYEEKHGSSIVDDTLTFQAFKETHTITLADFCHFMGLYTKQEIKSAEFRALPVGLPRTVGPQEYWRVLCQGDIKYEPSRSKASAILNDNLKIIHHILSHTIGARKSSNGVVNNFELGHLYSIAEGHPINVGVELAQFIIRQATDPRTKGIFCGGYITHLLKGMNVWKEPSINTLKLDIKPLMDGPFRHWGLQRVREKPIPSKQYSTPPRAPLSSSAAGPSTPQVSTLNDDWKLFRKEFQEEKKRNKEEAKRHKEERKKNKKFRSAVWSFLQTLASCLSKPPANLPTYESSPERATSEESEQPPVVHRRGKAPICESTSRDTEVIQSGDDEEVSDSGEEDNKDNDSGEEEDADGETEATFDDENSREEADEEDSQDGDDDYEESDEDDGDN